MHYRKGSMLNHLKIYFLVAILLSGCSDIPSSENLDNDINLLDKEINEVKITSQKYSGGLILSLIKVRLETLQSTKAMLEQKSKGFNRYIPVSYSIDGEEYSPPSNKNILLKQLEQDMQKLKNDLAKVEKENSHYSGGLIKITLMMQATTVKNSIAFLEQKKLLLKYDIPYYSILPSATKNSDPEFKKTPGRDIDKL